MFGHPSPLTYASSNAPTEIPQVADVKRRPDGTLEEAGEILSRLCTLAPRLADFAVAIRARSMTRVDVAKALLEVVDPAALTGALVVEVLLGVEAYSEESAIRAHLVD